MSSAGPSAPDSAPLLLDLSDATVMKDGRPVLDHLNLCIAAGQHTVILGPNGAGKSVLLRMLTLEERPLARDGGPPPLRILGRDSWNIFDLRTEIGFVSSDFHHRLVEGNSEGRLTGEAVVISAFLASYGVLRYGTITSGMRERAARALESVGAAYLAKRYLHQMSSGEARRVLLARVLVTEPKALVLDEPTTGLDVGARHAFMERVRGIARGGTTLILITHHLEEIVPEIQRVVLLQRGRVVADGAPRALLTAARLSDLFGSPLAVDEADGYYYARPAALDAGVSR
jgi:iron complex transport system ATP-binding protein